MTTGLFIGAYAVIATVVGMAYFTHQQWHDFFDRHGADREIRETLMLHLSIGAAAIGAAWPVAAVFILYAAYVTYARRPAERGAQRTGV